VTEVVTTVLAAGAVVVQIVLAALIVLALAAIFSGGARRLLGEVRATLLGSELWVAWGIAAVATLGSLYFSEIAHFVPCRLCWFQRIAMYPLAVILLVAAVRRDRAGALYALAFPPIGALVAGYHLYIEANPGAESASCKIGVPCSVKWIEKFGYVTLPMLAMTAFVAILTLLLMTVRREGA
jgi:disulfide bond formation protein DsbB